MSIALDWIQEHCAATAVFVIATDSQSLCQALIGYCAEVKELRRHILQLESQILIQWIPGHKGIEGIELADEAAKSATTLDEDPTPITLGSARAEIEATIKEDLSSHERSAQVYSKLSKKREAAEVMTRADQVLLARIRSGHH